MRKKYKLRQFGFLLANIELVINISQVFNSTNFRLNNFVHNFCETYSSQSQSLVDTVSKDEKNIVKSV